MLWCSPLPGKTGLKDTGNQATGSFKKEVWKNVSSTWIVLPIAILGSEQGLFFCLLAGLPHFSRPSVSPALSKKLSRVATDCLTSPWPLLLPNFPAPLYFKNVLIWQFSDRALTCAKHCAECFVIIILSSCYHQVSFIGKEMQVTLNRYLCY